MEPVLNDQSLYWADNGRITCGKCAGCSARFTGRDISGQPVEQITPESAAAFESELADIGAKCACETCGRIAPKVYV